MITNILIVLGLYFVGACLYYSGRSKGYQAGFQDGYGARWGEDSPGDEAP